LIDLEIVIKVDNQRRSVLIGTAMTRLFVLLLYPFVFVASASAMVGGAPPSPAGGAGEHAVLIVGSRGNSCTGVALAPDLVLTVAHCVPPGADYKLVEFDAAHQPKLDDVQSIARHPQFDLKTMLAHRATADLALLKLAASLPAGVTPAALAPGQTPAVGDQLVVAGYGVTTRGDGRSGGRVREANLMVTGKPGTLQIRLVDPATLGERAGLGACTGDSGAPAFVRSDEKLLLLGLVSWSTGPRGGDGCGGLTGLTPLALYRDWILATARKLGSELRSR
jgi:secreted trypsin-like serine protease